MVRWTAARSLFGYQTNFNKAHDYLLFLIQKIHEELVTNNEGFKDLKMVVNDMNAYKEQSAREAQHFRRDKGGIVQWMQNWRMILMNLKAYIVILEKTKGKRLFKK